jgi:hypothetical protein
MRADKLLPGGGLLAPWCGKNAVALQDIAHGLVTNGVPQMVQGTRDAVVAPGAILLREAHDQGFPLLTYWRSARDFSLLRFVKLLCDEFPMPDEDRLGLDDRDDFRQGLFAEPLTNHSERFPRPIVELDTAWDLLP